MKTFNITLPTSWAELSDKQLHLVYSLGQSFVGLVAKALDDNYRRYNH